MQKNKPNSQSVDVGENGSQPSQELIDQQAKLEVLSAEGEHSVGESNESRTFESTLTEEHPEIGHVERSHAQEWKAVEIAPDDVGAMLDNVRDRSEKAEFSVDASNAWECLQVSAAVVGCGPLSDSLLQSLVPRVIDHCNNDCNASNVSQEFPESRGSVADDILAAYRFGDGVTVVEQDNWSTEDPDDYTKIVYIEYDDDAPDADSHKVSFHVRFNSDGSVDDAYGLEMDGGND